MATEKQYRFSRGPVNRNRVKPPYCVKESLEELRLNERSGFREATEEQKTLYAALCNLPLDHFLVRRLSKGEANRAFREEIREAAGKQEDAETP